jgi:hypothetical protein
MKYYNVIVFYDTKDDTKQMICRKYRNVQKVERLIWWLNKEPQSSNWDYMNVYDYKTKEFVERIYRVEPHSGVGLDEVQDPPF